MSNVYTMDHYRKTGNKSNLHIKPATPKEPQHGTVLYVSQWWIRARAIKAYKDGAKNEPKKD